MQPSQPRVAVGQDGMKRVQASALLAVAVLFASCGGNGTESSGPAFTKQDVVKAAHLKPIPGGGYVEPRSKCKVTRILTDTGQIQDAANAGAPVAANPSASAGVLVGPRKRLACLIALKDRLARLASPGGPTPHGAKPQ
jgi:hypothetical protein